MPLNHKQGDIVNENKESVTINRIQEYNNYGEWKHLVNGKGGVIFWGYLLSTDKVKQAKAC